MFFPEEALATIPFQDFEPGFGFSPWETPLSPILDHAQTDQNSGSAEPDRVVSSTEERKLRRMISNRESARRSRMRKQRHLEDLRNQVNRLRSENRELANRVGGITQHCLLFRRDNDRLRSEYSFLQRRLSEIHRIIYLRQLHRLSSPASACCGFGSGNEQTLSSLMA